MPVVVDVMIIFCTANYQYIATIIRRTLFKIKETFEICYMLQQYYVSNRDGKL